MQIFGIFNPSVVITEKFRKCLKLYIYAILFTVLYIDIIYVYKLKYAYIAQITCIKHFLPLSRKGKTNSIFHVIVFGLSS